MKTIEDVKEIVEDSYIFQLPDGEKVVLYADWSNSASQIYAGGIEIDREGKPEITLDSTPFQVADSQHDERKALSLVLDYWNSETGAYENVKEIVKDTKEISEKVENALLSKLGILKIPEDMYISEVFEDAYGVYPIHVEDYTDSYPYDGSIFISEDDTEGIPEEITIIEDGVEKTYYVVPVREIAEDGRFHSPITRWYYSDDFDLVYVLEDGEVSSEDWRDPNDFIWYGFASRHPDRWWDAMRETGATDIMGVNPQKVDEVLVVTSGSDEYDWVEEVIPMDRLEKVESYGGRDYHAVLYRDKKTGKEYYMYVSHWQGSPDYDAEPYEEHLKREEAEQRFREE